MNSWAVRGYAEGRELGRGASGRVVEATSEATGQRVAIKYLSAKLVDDPEYMVRFRAEARLLTELEVPQVVQLLSYVEQPGAGAAIVMELVDGVSLYEMITRQGPTGPESALAVLKGSLLGLAAAHSLGIVHRDYKPENVLVDAAGASKLADFGVAVRAGDQAPAAGTPLYMAPEQWAGWPASPATDIYAATAVFYECLTGKTPFSGQLSQLRGQHERAAVPSADVDWPLRPLVERGMAKDPAARPANAARFVAELEATANAAYGPDWERRGRAQLAVRAAALLLLLLGRQPAAAGSAPDSDVVREFFPRKRRLRRPRKAAVAVASVVTVAAVAIASTAIASQTRPNKGGEVNHNGPTVVSLAKESVLATATVTPPAAAGSCLKPTAFTFKATLTASKPGPVTYQWVYSPRKTTGRSRTAPARLGALQTVRFTTAGSKLVSGGVVKTATAGTGWAELKVISPVKETSNKVGYRLLCAGHQSGHVTATATVTPSTSTVTCGTLPPSRTFTGTVTSSKAGPVTYYWALGDGATTTPATLLFKAAGTMSVLPLAYTPPTDSGTSNAVIVVTSPDASVSNTATFTLSCHGSGGGGGNGSGGGNGGGAHLSLSASAKVTPASSTVGCTSAPSTFTLTGTITASEATTVTYYWALSSGAGQPQTLTFGGPGTKAVVSDQVTPSSPNTYTGTGEIIIESPSSPTPASNKVTFTQSCANAPPHLTPPHFTTQAILPGAIQGGSYSTTISAGGGQTPYTWSASGLPGALAINPSTGTISGTAPAAGRYTFSVTVTDSETQTAAARTAAARTASAATPSPEAAQTAPSASAQFTLNVYPQISFTPATLADAVPGQSDYSASAGTVNGGDGSYTWAATGLPGTLAINPSSGVISGSAPAAGSYPFTVSVTDGEIPPQQTPPESLTLNVVQLSIVTTQGDLDNNGFDNLCTSAAAAAEEVAAPACPPQYQLSATPASGSYTWSAAASSLPPGVSLNAAGVLSDAPPPKGSVVGCSYPVQITVTDQNNPDDTVSETFYLGLAQECAQKLH
jgi:eukaryotic-like serine/threonine-protein kinase